jgi:hypothetical protein
VPTYECTIAFIKEPNEETTVTVEAENKGIALVENSKARPGTYVKAIREITPSAGQN